MGYEDIAFEVADDGVATLTINRPEVMNAVRPQTSRDIFRAVDEVRRNDAVRVLVITGAGRAFCAGDDFQAIFLAEDRADRRVDRKINRIRHGESSLDVIFALEKPTIASRASRTIARWLYFVRPPWRASRSNSTVVCSKPTQRVMPRRKRWRSGMTRSTSTTRRDMSRKSPPLIGRSSEVSLFSAR